MNKKFNIAFIAVIVLLGIVGAFAYQQVAVLNVPSVLDEQPNTKPTPTPNPDPTQKVYKSNGSDFQLTYPNEWQIVDNTPTSQKNSYGEVIQSIVLSNYSQNEAVSGGLPSDAIRLELVKTKITTDISIDQLIDCGGKTISCLNTEINGTLFKKATQVLNTGNTLIQLATKKDTYIYQITGVVSFSQNAEKNLQQLEKVINSLSFNN